MRKFIFCLLILFIFGIPGIALAQESGEGTIDGRVINDTPDGGTVEGLQVCLITYVNDELQKTATTTTDEEGKFHFRNLMKEYKYLVAVTYMDVDYYYPVVFSSDRDEAYVEVAVCDTTESDLSVKVMLAHKIIDFKGENAVVTEMFSLVNEGDRTYVGGEKSVVNGTQGILVFTLPQGATSFETPAELAEDLQLLGDRKANYDVPFPPGERQVVFSYQLPVPENGELDLSFVMDYSTDYLDVMVMSESVEVTTAQLTPAEPVETSSGDIYIRFTGRDIPRDSSIEIHVSRVANHDSLVIIIVSTICALILIAVPVYFVMKRRLKKTAATKQSSSARK
jgi:hypothetical protein